MSYLNEFLTVGFIGLLGAMGPGPDFLVVTQKAIKEGRQEAWLAVLGICCGFSIHIGYCIAGLGVVIASSPALYGALQYIGASYLIYLGIRSLFPQNNVSTPSQELSSATMLHPFKMQTSPWSHFKQGFLVNLTNVKAGLFTVSLFMQFVHPDLPLIVELAIGLELVLITALWFFGLSWFLTHPRVASGLARWQGWFDKVMGGCLILLGCKLFTLKAVL